MFLFNITVRDNGADNMMNVFPDGVIVQNKICCHIITLLKTSEVEDFNHCGTSSFKGSALKSISVNLFKGIQLDLEKLL